MEEKRKNKGNVPNLRFSGYEDDWKTVTIGECSSTLEYGMNSAAIKFDGENKYIRITDIDDASRKYKSGSPVSPDGMLSEKYLVKENDILFVRTGADTGRSYIYSPFDGKLYFAGFLIRARIKSDYNGNFIFAQTLTQQYNKWVKLMSMRSGQPGINSQEYSSFEFKIPSKDEQDKISSFLALINARIEAQSKIIEDLNLLNIRLTKSILCRKLRFKSKTTVQFNEWETNYLGSVCEIVMGQSPSSDSYNTLKIGTPLIQGNADISNRCTAPRNWTTQITKECSIDDVILTVRAPVGAVARSKHNACIGRGVCAIKNNSKNTLEFIYQFLLNFEDQWGSMEQGSTFTAVSGNEIKKIKVPIPSIDEQTIIVNFLSSFQKKLELEKNILTSYHKQKKYLLKMLFI